MNAPYSCILFDLDGTITDSAPGITSSLAWMFKQLSLPIPSPTELLRYVGPPMLDSMRELAGFGAEQGRHALEIYRAHYLRTGLFDSTVYDGIEPVLAAIHDSGIPFSLATSKPETPATIILEHYDLSKYFTIITGASDDEVRSSKADVVAEALARLTALGADISNPIMVGDREHDVQGAAENAVPTIFVNWGYGSVEEQVGTVAVAHHPSDLIELLFGSRAAMSVLPPDERAPAPVR